MYNAHVIDRAAHEGVTKTVERIRRFITGQVLIGRLENMCQVVKFTKQQNITKVLRPPMGSFTPTDRIFQRLHLIEPFPRTKNGHIRILIVLDCMSKFPFLCPLKKFTKFPIIIFMKQHIFYTFGVPEFVVCDNSSQFRSRDFESFFNKYCVKHLYTTIHSSQSNSSERVNRSINSALRAHIKKDQLDCDLHLSSINCA